MPTIADHSQIINSSLRCRFLLKELETLGVPEEILLQAIQNLKAWEASFASYQKNGKLVLLHIKKTRKPKTNKL